MQRPKKEQNGDDANGDVKAEIVTPTKEVKPRKKSEGMKQTKLNFKKKNFSDSDASDEEGIFESASAAVPERQSSRRAASKINYKFSDDDSDNKVSR